MPETFSPCLEEKAFPDNPVVPDVVVILKFRGNHKTWLISPQLGQLTSIFDASRPFMINQHLVKFSHINGFGLGFFKVFFDFFGRFWF